MEASSFSVVWEQEEPCSAAVVAMAANVVVASFPLSFLVSCTVLK